MYNDKKTLNLYSLTNKDIDSSMRALCTPRERKQLESH